MAVAARYSALASDLSGGAEDTTIADLEVFAAATQIEVGSGCRSAHVAKYNRLP